MRRAILLAGIASGITALFTTVTFAHTQRQKTEAVREYKEKLADLAFCRIGYEIAASKRHYHGDYQGYRKITSRLREINQLIDSHIKEAEDLPLDNVDTALMLEKVQWEAQVEAVHVADSIEEPAEFLDQIAERCEPYIN